MYTIRVTNKDHYLYVIADGELNPTTDFEIDEEVRKECENRKMDLVLIDIRSMTKRLSGIDNHLAAKTFRQRMGPDIRAIAIVDSADFGDRSEMYEVTAVNRGATVKFFEESGDAETWLLGFTE